MRLVAIKFTGFLRTDAGNADLLAAVHGHVLRYDHRRRKWLVWDEHRWRVDNDGLPQRFVTELAKQRLRASADIAEPGIRLEESRWAVRSMSSGAIQSTLKVAESHRRLADNGENWDADSMLLGVANGVLDLRTGKLRDGRPEDRISKQTHVTYDPNAECPRWLQFLDEVFLGDKELIQFVQRGIGYSLTGDTREHVLFQCHGAGANGKSTLLEIVRIILGDYSHALPFSSFEVSQRGGIPNDIASIAGTRFCTAIETNQGIRLNEARIKLLTGGDTIPARFLHKEFFTFRPTAKFWFAVNHLPLIGDASEGMWRRIKLIPFRAQFRTNADKNLLNTLRAEAPGILAWAVRGALDWQRHGLGEPPAVIQATSDYRAESDPVDAFLADCFVRDETAWTSSEDIQRVYGEWAAHNADAAHVDDKRLLKSLAQRGFQSKRYGKDRIRGWQGLRLRVDHLADSGSDDATANEQILKSLQNARLAA